MVNTQDDDGVWTTPPSAVARNKAGLLTIEEYIQRRVNTFLPFIQSRAIYQSCLDSTPTQATSNHPGWWLSQPHRPPMQTQEATAMAPQIPVAATTDSSPFPPPRCRSLCRETILV